VKTRLHLESSVITGLLIASIVPPTLEPVDIIGAAAAGMLAGLSKFLIAPGGRHILNPAATGITIAGFFGLTVGFWWVANPPLTPLILFGGLLVAYRAGVLAPVSVFLSVGFGALVARLLLSGEPLGLTLWNMVTAYPLLFLGLFMLSEPLTMPIRRVHQFVVAGLVGLGVALPFSIPFGGGFTLYSSPELVLVAGNLVGWLLVASSSAKRATGFQITSDRAISADVTEFTLTLESPLRVLPGQWVELHLPNKNSDSRGSRRVFSVSSATTEALSDIPRLTITTRRSHPGSTFKDALFDGEDRWGRITQVGGEFTPPRSNTMVCVAGGIGITPFVSWVRTHGETSSEPLDLWLVLVTKHPGEILYPDLVDTPGVTLLTADGVDQCEMVLSHLPRPLSDCHVAVSGSPAFVTSAKKTLQGLGARGVHTDRFIGY
jgi:ferredoxin-NADP reductase